MDSRGRIMALGWYDLPEHKKMKAQKVIRIYGKLLRMQLDAPSKEKRYSVRKLMAQGKIVIRGGEYVLP